MKSLKEVILESILDNIDDQMRRGDDFINNIKPSIEKFLEQNFYNASTFEILKRPNNDGKFIVNARKVVVKSTSIKSLTNEYFIWGDVNKDFCCKSCSNLVSLEGAPKNVGGNFDCSYCSSLVSLEGAPKNVGGNFDCNGCKSLVSLKGSPQEVGGDFNCSHCSSLTSAALKESPKWLGGELYFKGIKN
jgi:hypothetical protein